MWKKPEDQNQPASHPAAAAAQPALSSSPSPAGGAVKERAALGASISVVGNVSGEEDLLILGKVEGRIDLPQNLVTVGRSGRVQAEVFAKLVAIDGEVVGNVYAGESIVLRKSGMVQGNLVSPRVTLEDGCKFKGAIDMDPQAGERARTAARPGAAVTEPAGSYRAADKSIADGGKSSSTATATPATRA